MFGITQDGIQIHFSNYLLFGRLPWQIGYQMFHYGKLFESLKKEQGCIYMYGQVQQFDYKQYLHNRMNNKCELARFNLDHDS